MDLKKIAQMAVRESLQKNGFLKPAKIKDNIPAASIQRKGSLPGSTNSVQKRTVREAPRKVNKNQILAEALFITPQSFVLRTEYLSSSSKRSHNSLYNGYVDKFNKVSADLDSANTQEANANSSNYRSLNVDRTYNLNAIKLHELYFHNISDLASEISVDALPYMRLSRDFGNFEKWQFDFMAACRSAREGWAMVVYEPYRRVYMNVVVDSHNVNIPLGTVPVLVMDMWAHAYYKDYLDNKEEYVVAMMREINWNVVEARMILAEKSDLDGLYMIKPLYNAVPEQMLNQATVPPIDHVTATNQVQMPQQGNVQAQQVQTLPPTTPPGAVSTEPQQ